MANSYVRGYKGEFVIKWSDEIESLFSRHEFNGNRRTLQEIFERLFIEISETFDQKDREIASLHDRICELESKA